MEWILELALVALLGALKRDRVQLQELIAGFNSSTRQAEIGIEQLRSVVDGAGQQIAHHVDVALPRKDDLTLLIERGNRLADRLDALVRAGRPLANETPRLTVVPNADGAEPRVRSQAERDLLKALRVAR